MPFWCLSPVRVVYHGSFRENLESSFRGLGLSYVISQLDETHASLQNGAFEMLQFWCLSPVRVAYHGSFRENLGSAFWGFGLSYHNLIRQMQVFKTEHLKCCSFDAAPLSEWLITAHLEGIWSQHFGALGCHIAAWLGRCKSSKKAPLEYCSFDASPQSEWLITAHLERIWSQHFGGLWSVISQLD